MLSDEIKASYDLADYIAKDLGQTPKQEGNWLAFDCPFHTGSTTPKLKVKNNYATCFVCGILEGGSILDYVAVRRGLDLRRKEDYREVIRILSENKPIGKPQEPLRFANRPRKVVDFSDRIEPYRCNIPLAEDYFHGRGIIDLEPRLLTTDNGHHYFSQHQYRTLENIQAFPEKLTTRRMLIPYMEYGKCHAVNARRDDDLCMKLYCDYWELFYAIKIDIGERKLARLKELGEEIPLFEELMPSTSQVINHVFGDKYMLWKDSIRTIYNKKRIAFPDFSPKKLSYIFVSEGEITALSLEDIMPESGFMAIGAKSYRNLDKALSGVGTIYVLGENDTASDKNTDSLLHACGRWHDHTAKVLKPPSIVKGKRINDFNDFILTDREAAIAFLQRHAPMIEREKLIA